jgi:uncharacterized membrane protein (DUF485 family)
MGAAVRSDGASEQAPRIDWKGIERSPEFRELVRRRRRFVAPATVFYLGWYMTFILLAGYAQDFMGESVYQGLTVGYCLALTQFVMVLVLGILYLRKSQNVYDPLAERVVQMAERTLPGSTDQPAARRASAAAPGAEATT